MTKTTRRRVLLSAGAAGLLASPANAAFGPSFGARAGGGGSGGGGGGGTTLATLTLINDGGGASVAQTPTQSFGWLFNKGDIPSGQAPQFIDATTSNGQPFSASVPAMRSYYPDGSLKFAYFSLRPDFSLASGASRNITIKSGGLWPSSSSRMIAEVYGAGLAVSMPAASPTGANLTGTWGAWCNNTTNSANLINSGGMGPVQDMDGDAGARWRIDFNMSQTNGGTAHGQMVFTFYVHALNNISGALGGFRWTGYARQPWYNLSGEGTTKPAKNFRAFATPDYSTPANGPSWTASGVSATPMAFRGEDGNPISSFTFTSANIVAASNGRSTLQSINVSNNWGLGGSDSAIVPCYFTTTGTLPTGLTTTGIFFAQKFSTLNNVWIFNSSRAAQGDNVSFSGGSGTHTIHAAPCLAQFCRLGFRDDNGRMLFFQGSGSITAETTLRAKIDRTYWQSTGLIPPWDLTLVGSGSLTETLFNQSWHPHTIGSCEQDQDGATGVVQCIGWFPNDCGLDFYQQSVRSERATRCLATAGGHMPFDFLDATTNSRVNLSSTTYTGLPASIATTISWGHASGGFTTPPTNGWGMGFTSVGSAEHQVHYAGWAWLRFGELDYLDLVKDLAIGDILGDDDGQRNTDFPVAGRRGLPLGFDQEYRAIAWKCRAMAFAAVFTPYNTGTGLDLDGTKTSQQIRDLSALGWQQHADAMNPANLYFNQNSAGATTYMTTRGLWAPFCDRPQGEQNRYLTNSPEWEFAYIVFSACVAAIATGDTNARGFLTTVATRYSYFITNFNGMWNLPAYYNTWGTITSPAGVPHCGDKCFTRDQDYNVQNNYTDLSWVPGTTAAFTASGFSNGQTPTNGDTIIFYSAFGVIPGGLANVTGYFLVNVSYNGGTNTATFGVSDTAGGAAKSITDTSPTGATSYLSSSGGKAPPGITSHNAAMTTDWASHNSPFAMDLDGMYPCVQAARWVKAALSKSGLYTNQLDAVLTDMNFRLANTSGASSSMFRTLNGGTLADVRYSVADHFG